MLKRVVRLALLMCYCFGASDQLLASMPNPPAAVPEKIIIDTDIGDDIDDAFAVALALNSPELHILGLSAAFGDAPMRARMLDRILGETGHSDISVVQGIVTADSTPFSQRAYAEGGHFAQADHPKSVEFILDQIRRYPGQITLVAIGPLVNIGGLIDRDPQTFKKVKRVVMMGGWFRPRSDIYGVFKPLQPEAEWNIKEDISSAQKLFKSGVPIEVFPLDATANLGMDEFARKAVFSRGSPITDMLALVYSQWSLVRDPPDVRNSSPGLHDALTIAWMLNPSLCSMAPIHVVVDAAGVTREATGVPNAEVCLHVSPEAFLSFLVPRLVR